MDRVGSCTAPRCGGIRAPAVCGMHSRMALRYARERPPCGASHVGRPAVAAAHPPVLRCDSFPDCSLLYNAVAGSVRVDGGAAPASASLFAVGAKLSCHVLPGTGEQGSIKVRGFHRADPVIACSMNAVIRWGLATLKYHGPGSPATLTTTAPQPPSALLARLATLLRIYSLQLYSIQPWAPPSPT